MFRDKDYRRLINSTAWRKLRRETLKAHPLCQHCLKSGVIRTAREVHHIVPIQRGLTYIDKRRLALNPNNLVALCHDCHIEAHVELGRSGYENKQSIDEAHVESFIERFFN